MTLKAIRSTMILCFLSMCAWRALVIVAGIWTACAVFILGFIVFIVLIYRATLVAQAAPPGIPSNKWEYEQLKKEDGNATQRQNQSPRIN